MTWSARLKRIREAYDWSQTELAEMLGIHRVTVNRIENQDHRPKNRLVRDKIKELEKGM